MQTLQKVAGIDNGPTPSTSTFQNDLLLDAKVHYLIIDNENWDCLSPSPDFTFDKGLGEIDISPSEWADETKLIVVYSQNCQC